MVDFEVINIFVCKGVKMVVIKLPHGCHIMALEDWMHIWGLTGNKDGIK